MDKKLAVLIILDGFAYGEKYAGNAIELAHKPFFDGLISRYPNTTVSASGEAVGLPEGQMGNSEVGHLNIGAGRIVYQSLTRINKAIRDKEFFSNPAFMQAINHVKKYKSRLHIFGLLSDGGVHSHIDHILALIHLSKIKNIKELFIHIFLDGRDVLPKSAEGFIATLETYMKDNDVGKIATVSGRYYAMDRDKNLDRTLLAYNAMTIGNVKEYKSAMEGILASYENNVVDEFVYPFIVNKEGTVKDNDGIIFANFRPDRAIQLSTAFSNIKDIDKYKKNGGGEFNVAYVPKNICFVSMMHYAESVKGEIAFGLQNLTNTFGDYVSKHGFKQLRIAETQKYAHVTFFFDGGKDKEIPGAKRILIPSALVKTFDLKPEMSAYEVTAAVLDELSKDMWNVVVLNYANCDMVGHTGNLEATIQAVETVDKCLEQVVSEVLDKGGTVILTADHGNAEKLIDEEGKPFTAHTINPVPVIVTKKGIKLRHDGNLGDIAPTMLELLNLEKPAEMTGVSLIAGDIHD